MSRNLKIAYKSLKTKLSVNNNKLIPFHRNHYQSQKEKSSTLQNQSPITHAHNQFIQI